LQTLKINTVEKKSDTSTTEINITWSDFLNKIQDPIITNECNIQNITPNKKSKDGVIDVGGFIGGSVNGNPRIKESINYRSIISMSFELTDNELEILESIKTNNQFLFCYYSTQTSTPKCVHISIIVPLARTITCDEYEPVARRVAEITGIIDILSKSDYDVNKFMFWSSVTKPDEFIYYTNKNDLLDPDSILFNYYENWKNEKEWPTGENEFNIDWKKHLKRDNHGNLLNNRDNFISILEYDPNLRNKIKHNEFSVRMVFTDDLPWRKCIDRANGTNWEDIDDSSLRCYIEHNYNLNNKNKLFDALNFISISNNFHPIRNYLKSINWDGINRLNRFFVDYYGAEENTYTTEILPKWLIAAVARVMKPGIKFDNMLVIVGNQGLGKSSFGIKLGKDWFSDTITTIQGKEGMEQINGRWIVEMSELAALKTSNIESMKQFISKTTDEYRAPYDRHNKKNPRQCVFFGTTNNLDFLRDKTGNRRFWPFTVNIEKATKSIFNISNYEVDQIWAEAYNLYESRESIILTNDQEELAKTEQNKYMEEDPATGLIEDYLNKKIPSNWYDNKSWTNEKRIEYIKGNLQIKPDTQLVLREKVCVYEIISELFDVNYKNSDNTKLIKIVRETMDHSNDWTKSNKRQRTLYGIQPLYYRKK
jgi:predicted P-loop ATPase